MKYVYQYILYIYSPLTVQVVAATRCVFIYWLVDVFMYSFYFRIKCQSLAAATTYTVSGLYILMYLFIYLLFIYFLIKRQSRVTYTVSGLNLFIYVCIYLFVYLFSNQATEPRNLHGERTIFIYIFMYYSFIYLFSS